MRYTSHDLDQRFRGNDMAVILICSQETLDFLPWLT